MGNEESVQREENFISNVAIEQSKSKQELLKNKNPQRIVERKMSMGLLQKFPIFSHSSDKDRKDTAEDCSISSGEMISEDSPVTPPGPDLSHLSDTEREHIANVIARAKQIERDEDDRIREIENELNFIEEVASSRGSRHSISPDGIHCEICSKKAISGDSSICQKCVNCGRQICNDCGVFNSDPGSTFADFLCSICQKKRYLVLSSGMWFHGLCHAPFPKTLSIQDLLQRPKKSKIERTASYSQYEDMIERPKDDDVEGVRPKRTSLPCVKSKNCQFLNHSNPDMMNIRSLEYQELSENEDLNETQQKQINPEYQEVKNRFLLESNLSRSRSRRSHIQNQAVSNNEEVHIESPVEYNRNPDPMVLKSPSPYCNYTQEEGEFGSQYNYQSDENYDFPLVEDILNSDSSSGSDNYETYKSNTDNEFMQETDFPSVDEVLDQSIIIDDAILENSNFESVEPKQNQYFTYSNTTFKPTSSSDKEQVQAVNYDPGDRHTSLMGYYEQYDNQFEDYYYTEEEFRAIENFQIYNNELIRRNMNEDDYYRQIDQSDTDSDIAKYAASIATDTANLTNQTVNYDQELSSKYSDRFQDHNLIRSAEEQLQQSYYFPTGVSNLLSTDHYQFKKSILSPIQDLSPNSSRADEVNEKKSKDDAEENISQAETCPLKCDHDSDEECPWCYKDSTSLNSQERNSSLSLSSSSLSSKITSASTSSSSSNETLNNKSKSQLKRCQNYENISGLSESASADTLEDNNLIQEFKNDSNQDEKEQCENAGEFKKSTSLSRQQSLEMMPNDFEGQESENESPQIVNDLSSQSSSELLTNENIEIQQTIETEVPLYTKPTHNIEDRNSYDGPVETKELLLNTTTQRITTRTTENDFISDRRQSNFSSPTKLRAENNTLGISLQYPVATTSLNKFPPIVEYYSVAKDTLLDRLCIHLQVPIQIRHRKSLLNEEIRLVTQLRRQHLNDFVQIQNVELQLNHLRTIEKKQMTEIQEKLAEIQNTRCGQAYPRYSKSRMVQNYQDQNYYYYYPQMAYYRNPYHNYHPQHYYPASYNYPAYKFDQNFDDQRSSYSIHSSPQYLNYGGSYPKEFKYNTQYYSEPTKCHPRSYSRSTDQIAMYNYQNYPIELSHSDQGLVNMGYHYPTKVNDHMSYNIDIELMQKEQRVLELEREIELRKRQIEETIRYQEELLQLAELNNVAVQDYNNSYQQSNNDQIVEYDQINDYFINEKGQNIRQYQDDNQFYPYDNLPVNQATNQQQYCNYYENMYQSTDPRENVLYTEPIFQSDPYYHTRQVPKYDNYYNKLHDSEVANLLDQPQQNLKCSSNIFQRFESHPQDQDMFPAPQEIDTGRSQTKRGTSKSLSSRPLSGEYENVNENEQDVVDNRPKQENLNRAPPKHYRRKDIDNSNKQYAFQTKRLLLMRDSKEKNLRGNGVGMRIIGGQLCSDGHLGAFIEEIFPGSVADRLQDQIKEGDELVEWNGVPLIEKTFEDVRAILKSDSDEIEVLVRVGSISKSTETSKGNSESSEPNPVKTLTSLYDNINLREQSEHKTAKKHPKFAEEITLSHEMSSDRRSLSIKRQKAQEYEMSEAKREPHKELTPTKERTSSPICNTEIDCGSPMMSKKESPNEPSQSSRQRLNSKTDITTSKTDLQKTDLDPEKDDKSSENTLGSIQLIINFDDYDQSLTVHVAKAKHLLPMDLNGLSDPFVKIRLHPDPTEDPDYNRQTRFMANTLYPEWQQTMVFMNILKRSLKKRVLDVSVWDFDRLKANDFMGQTLISLANKLTLDGKPHWYKLTEMKEVEIPGLRQPTRGGPDPKGNNKTKPDTKSSKEIKNFKDEIKTSVSNSPPSTTISSVSPNMPKFSSTITIPNVLPEIKITKSIESSSPQTNPVNFRPARNPASAVMSEKYNSFVRADTADSKSSNSSSVTTDFLSEEQREIVRKWLGPGQLLMLSYTQRVDKVGNLPDDSLVAGELFLSLRKIADENTLIVSAASLINLKSKNTTEIYIKFYLMYSEQQLSRVMKRKTRPLLLSETNNFNQMFTFNTPLEGMLLQVSLWSCGKGLAVHKMLGEAVIHLDDIEFVKKNSKKDVSGWYKLLKPDI